MTTSVTGSVKVQASLTNSPSSSPSFSTPGDAISYAETWTVAAGNAAGQMEGLHRETMTLTDGGSDTLDLSGGLTDVYGNTLTFTNIKLLIIKNKSTTRTVTVSFDDANGFNSGITGDIVLKPGMSFCMLCQTAADGWAVTGGSADIITLTNDAGSTADLDIIVGGDQS